MGRQEPNTLEEEKLLFHSEELWSVRVGKPLLLCFLCCLGSTQALGESALQGEVNKDPAFRPEDWKRGTSANWKVQGRSQRGDEGKVPLGVVYEILGSSPSCTRSDSKQCTEA